MLAHLHTGTAAPLPYIKYILSREFGWTPAEIKAIPLPELLELFSCMSADARYQEYLARLK